jgi:hypothetical protein
VVPLLTLLPETMTETQRCAMMDNLIHSVKVAIYNHEENGDSTYAYALFEEFQEWLVDEHKDVMLIDSIPC